MMNYSKPLRLHLFENYFQDINVSYHLQTLFNWIKDLLIWASLWSLWRRLTWQTLSRPHTIWHVITHKTVDLDSFMHLLDNFYESSFYNDSVNYSIEYMSFISLLNIYTDSEVRLSLLNNDLWATFDNQVSFPLGEPKRLKINISFSSRHVLDFVIILPYTHSVVKQRFLSRNEDNIYWLIPAKYDWHTRSIFEIFSDF